MIVLADFGLSTEPNDSRKSSGVIDLDEYIRANYVVTERFGSYLVLLPRTEVAISCAVTLEPNSYGAVDAAVTLPSPTALTGPTRLLRITGWAATPAGAAPLSSIEVRVNGYRVPAVQQCLPREDIAARLGQRARYSGYEVTIDPLDIPYPTTRPLDIAVDIVDRDGQHHPLQRSATFSIPVVTP